jgi:hypothetical protein
MVAAAAKEGLGRHGSYRGAMMVRRRGMAHVPQAAPANLACRGDRRQRQGPLSSRYIARPEGNDWVVELMFFINCA